MRHHSAEELAKIARQRRIAGWLLVPAVGGALAGVIVPLAIGSAPSVQADELPQPPEVSEPVVPITGPVQPIFDFADVVPWDPGKEPYAVTVERPLSTLRDTRPSVPRGRPQVAGPVSVVPPAPTTPQKGAEPVKPNDPLHDDGTFGDGCEQPGTRPRCDPVVGLPPVVAPPVDEAEQPPIEEPAEEETPVDEVEVVEPVTEVAG